MFMRPNRQSWTVVCGCRVLDGDEMFVRFDGCRLDKGSILCPFSTGARGTPPSTISVFWFAPTTALRSRVADAPNDLRLIVSSLSILCVSER